MKVLVIEDDASIRETLGMVLESYQFEAVLKSSGELALAYLQHEWPDVMLLDLTLQGMSGEEVYRQIQKQFGRVPPTLVISAAQEGLTRTQDLAGAYFLSKPYTIEELAYTIERIFLGKGAA